MVIERVSASWFGAVAQYVLLPFAPDNGWTGKSGRLPEEVGENEGSRSAADEPGERRIDIVDVTEVAKAKERVRRRSVSRNNKVGVEI